MRVLVTGGAGFIGAHLIEHVCKTTDWDVVTLDRLTYAGRLSRLEQFRASNRVRFIFHDIRAPLSPQTLAEIGRVEYFIHCAAESHVENSLSNPLIFVESNVLGTLHCLQAARELQVDRFVQVSTDEVFGPAPRGLDYKESDPLNPSNPYSATKAGAEMLCTAWEKCYKLPLILTRTMNNFGERQHPEKFVPMVMKKVLAGETVKVHSNGSAIGSRKWLHARNHADGILHLLKTNALGKFHIAGDEYDNLQMADRVSRIMGKHLHYELVDWHSARPGHDLRYSMDGSKIRKTWKPPYDFDSSLEKTVKWTLENQDWLAG